MQPPNPKQLVMLTKTGPAFSANDVLAAHAELDTAGVPRMVEDRALSLTSRIAYLRGQIESLRRAIGGANGGANGGAR